MGDDIILWIEHFNFKFILVTRYDCAGADLVAGDMRGAEAGVEVGAGERGGGRRGAGAEAGAGGRGVEAAGAVTRTIKKALWKSCQVLVFCCGRGVGEVVWKLLLPLVLFRNMYIPPDSDQLDQYD